ncbi:Na+/H+ antiporter subunit A [Paenibacillus sp. YYML68]|uniref:Na+/H+ antiporter subunit A n=1 Tax=Paenibacillus sp. YYML68 TaxID=2909250 RepID=UPI00248F6D7A|nr:Na+/H+ antiporter subunit A [Paenibacillus sp. YYML68]
MSLLHAAILLPFLYAVVVPLLGKLAPRIHTGWFVLPVPVLLFAYMVSWLPDIRAGRVESSSFPWIPSLGIDFTVYMDGLGLLFALLITGIGSLVLLYSIYYLDPRKEQLRHFYVYLLLFMGAMLGVVLSDNLIVLYGFWELTSLSSFLLIAFWYEREKSRYGAQKSMLITVLGGFAMLAGFVLLSVMGGTFSVRELIGQVDVIAQHSLFVPAMLLILLGAFTKSAQFPFHIWLPDAMEAPTPVSAYLHSATMVKAGIYLVARLTPLFGGAAEWFWLVSAFGMATLFWGSFSAVKQTDLKSILAFSTVSQLGLIMSLLGLGSAALYTGQGQDSKLYVLAITAAVFHLINHATFKGALFMVVGIIDHETGTRDIRKLGGLASLMPITFTFAVIGAFSMAGLPPFNGFLSKEMFFTSVLNASMMDMFNMQTWGQLLPVLAWVASVFTFVYCMLFVFRTFTGKFKPEQLDKKPHEAPLGMLLPPAVLATLVIVFGLFPDLLSYSLIEPAMASIAPSLLASGDQYLVHITFWHGWTTEIFMTIGVIAVGTLLYMTMKRWERLYDAMPKRLTLNALYDGALVGLERFSKRLTNLYMTGSIRDYLVYIFVFFIVVLGYQWYKAGVWDWSDTVYAPISIFEGVLMAVMLLAALAVPFVQSRLAMIILVGAVGYIVTLFFVIFRAPDLALTQLIVETVSVALFLLCFYHLPRLKKELSSIRFRATNLIISIGVGVIVTLIALSAGSERKFESIADYYVKESYNLAGGKNIVNVILVDFRGFDTLLEIMVLGIASLGIYALIKLRLGRGKTDEGQ